MANENLSTQRELEKIESRLAWLQAEIDRATGQRDALLREVLDYEGAHDRRPVGVR